MVRLTFNVIVSRRRFEDRKKIFRRKRVVLKNLIRHILTKKKEKKIPTSEAQICLFHQSRGRQKSSECFFKITEQTRAEIFSRVLAIKTEPSSGFP